VVDEMSAGMAGMGLLAGLLVGLTGVGAASLLTPLLLMMGIHPTVAVGSDLVYNSVTKLFGVAQHARQKTIDWRITRTLAYGSLPGAFLAFVLLRAFTFWHIDPQKALQSILGYVLVLTALATFGRLVFERRWKEKQAAAEEKPPLRPVPTILAGLAFGFMVGLTSIGSGAMFAVALLFLYRMRPARLVGTDIAHAFLLTTFSGLLSIGAGRVDYLLVGNLLIGSIPGVLLGSTLSAKVPGKPLRAVVSALVLISGLRLI
jgi:uncharacterized membrane protein YfcA